MILKVSPRWINILIVQYSRWREKISEEDKIRLASVTERNGRMKFPEGKARIESYVWYSGSE